MSHRLPPMVHPTAMSASNNPPEPPSNIGESSTNKSQQQQQQQQLPKAFKFGQVDHNLLMSRLYSTPLQPIQASSQQQYTLDMSMTSMHKPRIKKLEAPPPNPEPIVSPSNLFEIYSAFHKSLEFII